VAVGGTGAFGVEIAEIDADTGGGKVRTTGAGLGFWPWYMARRVDLLAS